ncbi:hypothetical protein DL769_009029 [Monosporascus sp. CRB-8-3]|nr:hypothetical protein DL769_009029 [Monosporascus sp. CRB-8-3]
MQWTETFMEHRADDIAPDWQASAGKKFDEIRRQRQASQEAKERTNLFKKFVKSFVGSAKDETVRRFDVDRSWVWKDVQAKANEGLEKEDERNNWRRHPIRFMSRSFQNNASNLEILLLFLPNTEFGSILCGALTLVLHVRIHAPSFLLLPEMVQNTEKYMELYANDAETWKAAEELYLGILNGVEAMLSWIDKKAFSSALKAVFKQQNYGKSVEENTIKEDIEDKVTNFRQAVDLARDRRLFRIEEKLMAAPPQAAVAQPRAAFLSLDQLRDKIGINKDLAKADVELAMIDADQVSTPALNARVTAVMENEAFRRWFQTAQSDILFINGRMQLEPEQEAASPLTLLSCLLYRLLSRSGKSQPVIHLCGQHNMPCDPCGRPSGMLRCLSAQLLDAARPERVDLSGFNLDFVQGVEAEDLGYLGELFKVLLGSAKSPVIAIVDGVSWLEEGPAAQDFGRVVGFWLKLIEYLRNLNSAGHGPVLKILLTNPGVSLHAEKWFAMCRWCVVDMAEVPGGSEDEFADSVDFDDSLY